MPEYLTTDQIRTLNDARTILQSVKTPPTREGGHADCIYDEAANTVFQAINVTRSYLAQPISDDLMHNREGDRTRPLGTADSISVVGDENGFELHISTEQGSFVVNIHGVASDLYWDCRKQIGGWLTEAEDARRTRPVTDDADAYPADSPKHPDWHSVHADRYDSREGK